MDSRLYVLFYSVCFAYTTSSFHCSQAMQGQGGFVGHSDADSRLCVDGFELFTELSAKQRKLPIAVCYSAAPTAEVKVSSGFGPGPLQTPGMYREVKQTGALISGQQYNSADCNTYQNNFLCVFFTI